MQYSYQFSEELQQEWEWSERYAGQPEILRYLEHVTERFDLARDIRFETRVQSAFYQESSSRWTIECQSGEETQTISSKYFVMATGCLSSANTPDFPGLGDFAGNTYHTGRWPHEGVDFRDRRVCVIGTGSSAVQSIPIIAEQASTLHVFQRTPSYSIPAHNAPLDPDEVRALKARYPEFRAEARAEGFGIVNPFPVVEDQDPEYVPTAQELKLILERNWEHGGLSFLTGAQGLIVLPELNEIAAEFVREKIRAVVDDPDTAELLCPRTPIGCKRLCVDTHYFEAYNRPHVSLVDISDSSIEKVTATGVWARGEEYECDDIVLATGFDAMTGALFGVDIRGRGGLALNEKWAEGPRTFLGLATVDFPNFFVVTGPGSPSVLSNMVQSIEQHVEWISNCVSYMENKGLRRIEAEAEAEQAWGEQVNAIADQTIFPSCNSWYLGANIPGKPRVFMPFLGFSDYVAICDEVSGKGYPGFDFV
jgi:cyclohexanone monooxygenase